MTIIPLKFSILYIALTFSTIVICEAQEGSISVNQDQKINLLMDLKKDMNLNNSNRYKIQIYSGNRKAAEKTKTGFRFKYNDWKPTIIFETPNYKIWVGNFRTRLEADRALKKIKKHFSSAFIFKPKKEKL